MSSIKPRKDREKTSLERGNWKKNTKSISFSISLPLPFPPPRLSLCLYLLFQLDSTTIIPSKQLSTWKPRRFPWQILTTQHLRCHGFRSSNNDFEVDEVRWGLVLKGSAKWGSLASSLGTSAGVTCSDAINSYFKMQLTTPVSGTRPGVTPSQLTGTFLGTD